MESIFFKKRGRRYVPVSAYDSEVMDAIPEGTHLVTCKPGTKMTRYNVQPDTAPVLAAIAEHKDAILDAIRDASKAIPQLPTAKAKRAWKAYKAIAGEDWIAINRPSAYEILNALEKAILKAMEARA